VSGNNWWVNSFPANLPGGVAQGGQGGYGTDGIQYRNGLDAKRVANGFAPGASWPDGYLGNISGDRQADKLAINQPRLNDKSYVRGVHVGEKVPSSDYFWNDKMNPDMGLERQAAAVPADVEGGIVLQSQRFAPTGDPVERLAHDGVFGNLNGQMQSRALDKAAQGIGVNTAMNPPTVVDPTRRAQMAKHLPRWSGVFQS
jgi:hypothetical protein